MVGGSTVGEFDVPISSLTYIVNGLNPNTEYLIQVFGLKGGEVSPVSEDAQAKTHPAASVPASPTNLGATPTKNSMALSWSGPADASSYKISYGLAPQWFGDRHRDLGGSGLHGQRPERRNQLLL